MTAIFLEEKDPLGLSKDAIVGAVRASLVGKNLHKVLLVPPDFTRFYSHAGLITNTYYHALKDHAEVDVLPALGTHAPMTPAECAEMFGDIPFERFLVHDWRNDVVQIGQVPAEYLSEISEGLWDSPIACEINRRIMDPSYDLIISIGQVVPHEVVGIANHSKNLFVGCGGTDMIGKSHLLGAVFGMERMMGKDHTPVRKLFDYCFEKFLSERPVLFALTVTTAPGGEIRTHGLYIGETREGFEKAVTLCQQKNLTFLDRPIHKCVVYLEPKEFKSTWLGIKAIYRSRMAIATGGELLVLAPGVSRFGEDRKNDEIIRKYGYPGRLKVLELFRQNEDLRRNMGVAAHLIHGSSDGRFQVTYAVKAISQSEIRGVHFQAADYDEMIRRYDPTRLLPGWNVLPDGEEIFFIPNPALGLWVDKTAF